MDIDELEERFNLYLGKGWDLGNIKPFLTTYAKLLLLFESEYSKVEVLVVFERLKQISGEEYNDKYFAEVMRSNIAIRNELIGNSSENIRSIMLNQIMLCTLLDTEETDLFYMTEPMFEFVRNMGVSPHLFLSILEAEFSGFNEKA